MVQTSGEKKSRAVNNSSVSHLFATGFNTHFRWCKGFQPSTDNPRFMEPLCLIWEGVPQEGDCS